MSALHPSMVQRLADDRIAGRLENAERGRLGRKHARTDLTPRPAGMPAVVPGEPSHGDALRAFLRHLSPQTSYRRFVTPARPENVVDVGVMLAADSCHRAFVAVVDDRIVAHAHAVASPDTDRVELGVVVADEWQGQGIGSRLVHALLGAEPAASAAELEFFVLAANMPARRLIRRTWPDATGTAEGDLVHLRVATRREAPRTAPAIRLRCHA
jgi:GNAT superfamily N-acetyltransferase